MSDSNSNDKEVDGKPFDVSHDEKNFGSERRLSGQERRLSAADVARRQSVALNIVENPLKVRLSYISVTPRA